MKLTKQQLQRLVQEELYKALNERLSARDRAWRKERAYQARIRGRGKRRPMKLPGHLAAKVKAKIKQFLNDGQIPNDMQIWVKQQASSNEHIAHGLAYHFIPTYQRERAQCAARGGGGGAGGECDKIARIMAIKAYNDHLSTSGVKLTPPASIPWTVRSRRLTNIRMMPN